MKTIFEYLISKANKKNISFSLKDSLRTGDIVVAKGNYFWVYYDIQDFDIQSSSTWPKNILASVYPAKSFLDTNSYKNDTGLFINLINGKEVSWMPLSDYDNNLKCKDGGLDILSIYTPKNGFNRSLLTSTSLTDDWIKKEIKNRIKKDI